MTPYEEGICPLCGGASVTLPIRSLRGYGYVCRPCRGIFIVSDDARNRYGKFDVVVRETARAIFASRGWARIELAAGGVSVARVPGGAEGRGPEYFDGQMARLAGLGESQNPNEIGDSAHLDWRDGWVSIGLVSALKYQDNK